MVFIVFVRPTKSTDDLLKSLDNKPLLLRKNERILFKGLLKLSPLYFALKLPKDLSNTPKLSQVP